MDIINNYEPPAITVNEQKDKISVAIAVFNSSTYLRKTIDSVRNQTYKNLEIILVDDGSTDDCPAICDEYAQNDSRIKVIHKKNEGLFSSRNVGIDNATGEYITFLDGDDWIEPIMYEKMLSALKDTGADMSICRFRYIYKDRVVDQSTGKTFIFYGQEILEALVKADDKYLIQNAAWNKLYKRSLIENLRFPHKWYEDMIYTIHLLNKPQKTVYIDQAYHNYICDRQDSIMNTGINPRIFTDSIPNWFERSAFLRKIGREDLALIQDYTIYKRLLIYYVQVQKSKEPKKNEYKKVIVDKVREGKKAFPKIYATPGANPHEYQKMKIFLASPKLFMIIMWFNEKYIIPYKIKKGGK